MAGRKKLTDNMRIQNSRKCGFTLVEMMIVVALIGLLAAIAIPTMVHARTTSQTKACINNLREIFAATQQWALEGNKSPTSPVAFSDIQPYLKHSVVCPTAGTDPSFYGSYTLNGVSVNPVCNLVTNHFIPPDTSN
jgi:type IV pilus assembly protein PilA